MKNEHTIEELRERQALPLEAKVMMTQNRIHEWQLSSDLGYKKGVVSFSGGKDSTVLLHIARKLYPDIPAVFSNTGLEYPEIQAFVKRFDNVTVVRPKMRFDEVISKYGYPLIGKEVAEAIYYARRIRSQTVQVERERETQQGSVNATNSTGKENGWKRLEMRGGEKVHLIQTSTARNRRTVLSGRMPGAGVENGKTGEGAVFSKGTEQFGEKSQFNKEKYLPLARDIPVPISHYCCQVMKKEPLHKFQKQSGLHPILATMAEESRVRRQAWLRTGCNAFEGSNPKSQPMSFWTEQDVLQYIVENGIEIASVYGDIVSVDSDGNEYDSLSVMSDGCKLKCTGCQRTGCIFCAFGFHNEKGVTRFQRLSWTHPRQYEYCMGGGQWVYNPAYDAAASEYDGEWKNWNPKKIWVPSKKGLGMKKVFDMVNEIYGKNFYRYE